MKVTECNAEKYEKKDVDSIKEDMVGQCKKFIKI